MVYSLGVTLGEDEYIPEGEVNFFEAELEAEPDECIESVEVYAEVWPPRSRLA